MGPMDAKMKLVKKEEAGEMEIKEAKEDMEEMGPVEKQKMEKELDEAIEHVKKEDDKKAEKEKKQMPANCKERGKDKNGDEKVVCTVDVEDLEKEVHKKQKHDMT